MIEHFTPLEAPVHETQRLPVMPPAQIIGRNSELGQIFAQVRAGAAVLLHGPDGVGKSALAATLAAAFSTFPGGVLWWPVEGDSLPQLVARLGRAYHNRDLSDSANPEQEKEALQAVLARDSNPTVVLDGRLDLDVARDFVRKVVPGFPVIITNEEGGPGPWTPFEIGPLDDEGSEELFIQAAGVENVSRLVRADIRGICNAVGGQPLVITLAARHVRAIGQTPGEFLGALTMTAGMQGTMLGLNSIFHHLPDELQSMLLTMGSTLAGTASSTLLDALQLSPGQDVTRVMDLLAARGLVQPRPSPAGIRVYTMHPLIRRFAEGWLRDTGRLEAAIDRMRQAVLEYAEQHAGDTHEARSQLVVEMCNMMALAHQAASGQDFDTVRRLAQALQTAFGSTGGYGYELHQLMRLSGDAVGPAEEELPAEDTAPQMELVDDEPSRAAGAWELPDFSAVIGESSTAEQVDDIEFEPEAEEMTGLESPWSSTDDAVLAAEDEPSISSPADAAFVAVSSPAAEEEESDAASGLAETGPDLDDLLVAVEAARDTGRTEEIAQALNVLGQSLLDEARSEEAQEAFAEALVLYEDIDDTEGMLLALEGLASISLDDGDLDNAIVYATRAENLATQGADPARHGHLLALLGDVQLEVGELDNAIATYVNAIEMLQATGDELSLGIVQTKLGNAHLDREDFTRAITMLTEALGIFERQGQEEYQGRVLGNLGTAYGRMGQWQEAEGYHARAAVIAARLGDIEEQERQLANLAFTAQARGDRVAMLRYYRRALDLAYRAEEVVWQVRYLDVLGRMLMDDVQQVGLAVMVLEEADGLVPNDERIRWLKRAKRRLDRIKSSAIPQQPLPASLRQWAAEASSDTVEV